MWKFLKFGMFLLVLALPVLKSLSLKKPGFAYNLACPFPLNDFSPQLGYFSKFCGLILHQHMPKKFLSIRNDKQVRRSCKAPTENHHNQWESARNITGIITGVNLLPYLGLDVIITFSSKTVSNGNL